MMVLLLKELSHEVEEALVKCLEMCSEFQYPLKRRDLQDLVQSYLVEHNIKTRFVDDRPGKDWTRLFQKRWSHRVKIRKPRNIKRSRANVSPKIVRSFFARLQPNLDGVPASHIFNYDETCIKARVYLYIVGKTMPPPPLPLDSFSSQYVTYAKFLPILHGTVPLQFFKKINLCMYLTKDDPGAQDAFFGGGSKYFEQIRNHSRVGYSVMFCVRCV